MTNRPSKSSTLTAIEMFAGIGGFRLAADQLGIDTLWANDLDPDAAEIYRTKFVGSAFVEGDVFDHLNRIPRHDILTAGFPCQPYSYAGKKLGTADSRANALSAVVHTIEKCGPRAFLLENVKSILSIANGEHFGSVLSALLDTGYHIEWRTINARSLGLPQNRNRVLISGFPPDGQAATEFVFGKPSEWARFQRTFRLEEGSVRGSKGSYPEWGRAQGSHFEGVRGAMTSNLAPPMSTVLVPDVDSRFDFTTETRTRIKSSTKVHEMIDGVEILWNQDGGRRMGYTVYGVNGSAPTLTCTSSRHYERFKIGRRYRRLTPVEYARLQGFPDDHCSLAGVSKQYVLYGNAIPPILAKFGLKKVIRALGA